MAIDFADDSRGVQLRLLIERAKYERWVISQVSALLDREYNRLADLLLSPAYRDLTRFQQQRAQALFREVSARLGAGYRDLTVLVTKEMQGYATLEADVARAQVSAVLTAGGNALPITLGPSLRSTYLASIAKLPIQGLRLGEWFDGQVAGMSLSAKRIVQQGLVEGKGNAEIARRLVAGPRVEGPVLVRRARTEAAAITRTTVNAVQNDATLASLARLPASLSDSYRLLVVRDARTSVICSALADRVFRYDDPDRMVPPFHINCRTSVQPIIKGADESVSRQKTGSMSFASYADWLKAQPATTQNEILGAARADLWRSGRMQLADAIDADNRILTLAQLRASLGL